MIEEEYLSLCEKYFKGDCTQDEVLLIKKYQDEAGMNDDLWDIHKMSDQNRIKGLIENRLQNSLRPQKTPVISLYKWKFVAAAASVFLISIGLYYISLKSTKQVLYVSNHNTKQIVNSIQPGTNKAILTLSNGNRIILDSAKNGPLSKQGNAYISKSGNSLIVKNEANNKQLTSNTLSTITIPRGGKYNIVLPDGTKVWLNSSSSLTFPTVFSGTERKITLTGEAYFEVAKNKKMPFKINVNDRQVVEVLGTHFNISAYTDENKINTTLLEGSVKVHYKNTFTFIRPGQMAVNDLSQSIKVKEANIDEVMAWKNGMFVFDTENITSVMKKVSRWYDVDLVFKGDMSNINFDGNYSRSKSLANLLKNIELMEKVHFIIEGRRVTIISQ